MNTVCKILLLWVCFTLNGKAAHGPVHEQINQLTKLIQQHPDSTLLYLERGLYYQIDEDLDAAITDLQQVLFMDTSAVVACFPLAEIYFKQNDFDRSRIFVTRHLQVYPQHANSHDLLGHIWMEMGEDDKAAIGFQQVVEIKEQKATPENFINWSLASTKNNPNQALAILQQGIQTIGAVASLQIKYIELANQLARYDLSLSMIDQLLATANRKEYWLLQKGLIMEAKGDYSLAKQLYQNCLSEIAGLKQKIKETDYVKNIYQEAQQALQSQ